MVQSWQLGHRLNDGNGDKQGMCVFTKTKAEHGHRLVMILMEKQLMIDPVSQ